ncbi:hypothetical protein HAX54_031585 [Datura stramonium]|uniref:Bifunctional inhibitor/plant lipid transfer protein/seed storage helical domain-containing protein n=1 Tax=Datura stramonium TaxID=4076 RepID=A0ABS8RL83_DATST|nr:hypothetical protein [Datura stramonium]
MAGVRVYETNSSSNGMTSPTEDCCSALRTMMTNATNCMCLIVTGGIPFQMPINPNIAMSLPSACNMPGVPLKCKDSTVPPPSPSISSSPADEIPTLTPPSPPADSSTPVTNSGSQTPAEPSAAPSLGYGIPPLFLLAAFGAIALSLY